MTTTINNEDYKVAPAERTVIYENNCRFSDGSNGTEKIYHNADGTFDAVIVIGCEVAAEWVNCPDAEYAAASIEEFDVENED